MTVDQVTVGLVVGGQPGVGGGGAAGVVPGGRDPRHGPLTAVRVAAASLQGGAPFLFPLLLPLCVGQVRNGV